MIERFIMDPDTAAGIKAIGESRAKTLFPEGIGFYDLDLPESVANQPDELALPVDGALESASAITEEGVGK